MLLIIISIILLLILLIAYFFVIKPYLTIQSIKKAFQSKGYKVLVQKLDFNDDTITASLEHDAAVYKDSLHRYKTIWQDYDVTIKNSFFAILVNFNSIELVKEGYRKIQFLQKPSMLKSNYSRFYGGGLLMKDGDQWKAKRKLYSEIFNYKLLEDLHPIVEQSIESSMNSWKVNENIDLLDQFRTMFFEAFVACYFGRQFDEFKYQDQSYSETVAKSFQELLLQAFSLRHMLLGTKVMEKGYFNQDKIIEDRVAAIKVQTKEFVKKRWEQISHSQNPSENSILSKLVFNEEFNNLSESGRQKALQDITGDLIIFFFAGTDSSSGVLAATLHMLIKHPQVAQKLIEQINASEDNLNSSTIKGWKYMDAVFNEVLRLYGPLNWIFVREMLSEDFTIGGVQLPKDTIIGIQTHTIHTSETYYEKADQFMPERFMTERKEDPYTFVAFGGGQRNCIGQYLARIQFKMALASILKKFDFTTQDEFVMYSPSIYQSKNNHFTLTPKAN